jgi:hypothetical protein
MRSIESAHAEPVDTPRGRLHVSTSDRTLFIIGSITFSEYGISEGGAEQQSPRSGLTSEAKRSNRTKESRSFQTRDSKAKG